MGWRAYSMEKGFPTEASQQPDECRLTAALPIE